MSTPDIVAAICVVVLFLIMVGGVCYFEGMDRVEKDAVKNGMAHWEITNEETGEVEFKWGPKP